MARKPRDPFAVELGKRIEQARKAAGFTVLTDMVRASRLDDIEYNKVARWCRGDSIPHVKSLAEIARVCRVSLDWLVFGAETNPAAFLEWLETPMGQGASQEARAFLRSLPLRGHTPTSTFYDLALVAFRHGLSPVEVADTAKQTERLQNRQS